MRAIETPIPQRQLKQVLEQQHSSLLDRLRVAVQESRRGDSVDRDAVLDTGDASQNQLQADIFFALMQLTAGAVADGDEALRRLEQGRYGVCDACGGRISEQRLRAIPFARRCLPCEAARDGRRETAAPAAKPHSSRAD